MFGTKGIDISDDKSKNLDGGLVDIDSRIRCENSLRREGKNDFRDPRVLSWIYRIFFYFVIAERLRIFFLYFSPLYVSPAQAERDLNRVFIVGGFVEGLQRFHALVLRATRRVAMVQHRLEEHLALWIVSGTREEGYALLIRFHSLGSIEHCGSIDRTKYRNESNEFKGSMLFVKIY